MLGLHKQGFEPVCVAYSLWNLGVIDEETASTYHGPGQPWIVIPWLKTYVPELVPVFQDVYTESIGSPFLFQWEEAEKTLPKRGRGLVFVDFWLNGVFPLRVGAHVMAWEDGRVSDSGHDESGLITWQEYKDRVQGPGEVAVKILFVYDMTKRKERAYEAYA